MASILIATEDNISNMDRDPRLESDDCDLERGLEKRASSNSNARTHSEPASKRASSNSNARTHSQEPASKSNATRLKEHGYEPGDDYDSRGTPTTAPLSYIYDDISMGVEKSSTAATNAALSSHEGYGNQQLTHNFDDCQCTMNDKSSAFDIDPPSSLSYPESRLSHLRTAEDHVSTNSFDSTSMADEPAHGTGDIERQVIEYPELKAQKKSGSVCSDTDPHSVAIDFEVSDTPSSSGQTVEVKVADDGSFGPCFKDQVRRVTLVQAQAEQFLPSRSPHGASDTIRAAAAAAAAAAATMAEVEDTEAKFGPEFKDQVRRISSAEARAQQLLRPRSPHILDETEEQRRGAPTQTASVWEPNTVPTVPAMPVDDTYYRALSPESLRDSAIQLRYEGPTEEEVNLLRLKVLELQTRLQEQDEIVRQLREALDEPTSTEKVEQSNQNRNDKPEQAGQLRCLLSQRRSIWFSLLCLVALAVVLGAVFGTIAGEQAMMAPWPPETFAPNEAGTTPWPLETSAPSATWDNGEGNSSTTTAVIVSTTVVGGLLGLLVVVFLVRHYKRKIAVSGERKEQTQPGTDQTRVQQNIATQLEAKLSYRREIARELDLVLQKLKQYPPKESDVEKVISFSSS